MLKDGDIVAGKYKVIRRIGIGGMSEVYLVINEAANKLWALKEIRKDGGQDRDIIEQTLITETHIMKQLHHEHMPDIIDIIETDTTYQILMEYVEGITLLKKLEQDGALPQSDVVKWAIQMCDLLIYLHTLDPPIIYRDMKPANIMLKPDGNTVLIDFGTAREYKKEQDGDTTWLGTRGYAAPEQFGGQGQTDARTDIFNLGATLYHLVTDHNPCKYPYEIRPIREWNPALSGGLEAIINKCTRPNPEERYQNCQELKFALEHYQELEEGYRAQRLKEIKLFAVTLGLSAMCFVGFGILSYHGEKMTRQNYSSVLHQAQTAPNVDAQIAGYEEAIRIDPSRYEAYDELINRIYLTDGNFSQDEAEAITALLDGQSIDGKSSVRSRLESSKSYGQFAYQMGLAYFYYYNEIGSKPLALSWFDDAKDASTLSNVKKLRAERFYKISDYYTQLGKRDKAGDSEVSYVDYWNDICELTDDNIVESDNIETAMVMYKEILYQIMMHANDFRKAGLEQSELDIKVKDIEQHLTDDFSEDQMDEDTREEYRSLQGLISAALKSSASAYSRQNKGGTD